MKQLATVVAGLAVLVLALATGALAGTPGGPGAVYALTNSAQGNAVAVYDRSSDGQLSSPRFYPTAGLGSGAGGLGSQGSVALTTDGHLLLAVNAGSNTVSAFAVTARGLQLLDVVPSFGTQPVSIALRGHVAFVVNATSLSIHGYSLDKGGLTPIAGSGQALSPNASTPSQIAFAPNGVLVVTERGSNTIDSFTLDGNQVPSAPKQIASVGNAPFGFDFAHGNAIVSDANAGPGNSAATSYAVGDDGTVSANGPPVQTGQGAACWLVTSKDGRYAFTANAGSGTISTFAVAENGALTLERTTTVSAGAHIIDEAVSANGRFLYVIADRTGQVYGFRIGGDGSLTALGAVDGLPAGNGGLAAS
jgi:6-phosphogluconolactonase (cycloisomerase 2 family)